MAKHVSPVHASPTAQGPGMARREFLRCALGMGAAATLAGAGCSIPANYVPDSQPISNAGAITSGSLGLVAGVSKKDTVIELLRKKGITNIATARGLDAKNDKVTIDAVTGDNMLEVLLFRNLVFHRALGIGADAGTATRMHLHVAKAEGWNAVIVVSPDIVRDESNSMVVLLDRVPQDRFPPKRYFIPVVVSNFPEWAGGSGMTDPLMNGHDLDGTGVTFVARGTNGWPWEYALIIKCDGKQLNITPVGMQKVLGCECLSDWFWKKGK